MSCPICKEKHTAYFTEKKQYVFFRCSNCKTVFLRNIPPPQALRSYYLKHFSYKDGLLNEKVIRARSKVILHNLKKLCGQPKTICDIGSGYGFFLSEAKRLGYIPTAVEPSQKLAHHIQTHYQIPTYHMDLYSYASGSFHQFDIVTCIHVIEHVSNPREFISKLALLVKPGGVLYIETPNSDSHLLYTEKEQYTFLIPPEHLWLFSHIALQKMLPKCLLIHKIHTYSYSEHVMGILKRILGKKKNKLNIKNTQKNTHKKQNNTPTSFRKFLSYLIFDRALAYLFTGILNINHKGSILELYIKKKM